MKAKLLILSLLYCGIIHRVYTSTIVKRGLRFNHDAVPEETEKRSQINTSPNDKPDSAEPQVDARNTKRQFVFYPNDNSYGHHHHHHHEGFYADQHDGYHGGDYHGGEYHGGGDHGGGYHGDFNTGMHYGEGDHGGGDEITDDSEEPHEIEHVHHEYKHIHHVSKYSQVSYLYSC